MANLPGYPTPAALRAQAAAATNAALPSVGSITQPYNQSIGDVKGFAQALLTQLQQGVPAAGNAYSESLADQNTVNAAAQQRLAALGPYAAGSQAAVGGVGDSATSRLLEDRAAAQNYASRMPDVGAARASLAQAALIKQRQQALQQRQQDYKSTYSQALQTAQDNALQRSVAIANIGNQQAQLALSRQNAAEQTREFNVNSMFHEQQLTSQNRQFLIHEHDYLQSLGAKSPAEASQLRQEGAAASQSYVMHGIPFNGAVRDLIQVHGIPRKQALAIAGEAYAQTVKPDPNDFKDKNGILDQAGYQAALTAYNRAFNSFHNYLKTRSGAPPPKKKPAIKITAPPVGKPNLKPFKGLPPPPKATKPKTPPGTRIGGGTYNP